jgi:hypothetical protein
MQAAASTSRDSPARPASLSELLRPASIDLATLRDRYGMLLELVRRLIGVIPHCDGYLEIWPPALRSYNVMVPNFLNLPFFLWGVGAPKTPVALAMYAASRSAGCMYCSAHTCAFALRRGAEEPKIATAPGEVHTDAERAAIALADAMAQIPAAVTQAQRDDLRKHLSPADAEWVVLCIAMMGFLNKTMDALGVDLEAETVEEVRAVIEPSGWTTGKHAVAPAEASSPPTRGDGLGLKVGLVRFLPSALAFDRRWTAGVPARWPEVGEYLRERTGHDFPVLQRLQHARAVRALATMVRDNCEAADSRLGLEAKHRAGLVYATVIGDESLAGETRVLARNAGAKDLDDVVAFAAAATDFDDAGAVARLAAKHGPATLLAKAASYSPARVTPSVVERAGDLEPAAVIELLSWLSVLQLLHRLGSFYGYRFEANTGTRKGNGNAE